MIFWAHGELRITEIMKSPSTMYWIWQVLSGKPCFQLSISNDFNCETLRHHGGNSPKWITIGFQGPKVETPNITKQRFRLQLDLYAKVQWRPKTLSWPPKFQIHSVILIENPEFLSNFMEKKMVEIWIFTYYLHFPKWKKIWHAFLHRDRTGAGGSTSAPCQQFEVNKLTTYYLKRY